MEDFWNGIVIHVSDDCDDGDKENEERENDFLGVAIPNNSSSNRSVS